MLFVCGIYARVHSTGRIDILYICLVYSFCLFQNTAAANMSTHACVVCTQDDVDPL